MKAVRVSGASDDLIEVEGDISEEFGAYDSAERPMYLAFSDGTVLSATYGAGSEAFWRINRVAEGTAAYAKHEATDEESDYSDVVTLSGDLRWCVCGTGFARGK